MGFPELIHSTQKEDEVESELQHHPLSVKM